MRVCCRYALKRRQDLPERAFIGGLEEISEEDRRAALVSGKGEPSPLNLTAAEELERLAPQGWPSQFRVAVLAVSHCWRSREHPDPYVYQQHSIISISSTAIPLTTLPSAPAAAAHRYGETLLLLADTIKSMQAKRRLRLDEWAKQHVEYATAWKYKEVPLEFGIFFDWCSVMQVIGREGHHQQHSTTSHFFSHLHTDTHTLSLSCRTSPLTNSSAATAAVAAKPPHAVR